MRKSISVSFFFTMAILLAVGVAIMGISQTFLFQQYFIDERYKTLDDVAQVTRLAVASRPSGLIADFTFIDEFGTEIKLIGDSAEVGLFLADAEGNILICNDNAKLSSDKVDAEVLNSIELDDSPHYHTNGNLEDLFYEKSYVSITPVGGENGLPVAYLFVYSSSDGAMVFLQSVVSNFLLSASLMLLFASVLTMVFTNRLTAPLQELIKAAQKFGGGDLTTRVEVKGDDEVAQLATNFNLMAANLQEIDNSRSQFTGNIAHELRTPMTSIKGFVDGMIDGTIPQDQQQRYLKIVSQETGRLARLVQNMLDISKLESGEYKVHSRLYPIEETLMGAALSAEQRITAGEIEVEGLSVDKTLVYADPDLVHQVVYNLIDNAIKFTPKGGVISFSVLSLGPDIEVSITNTGEGISEEALPFVFERFYKEDASRGLNAKGSGLGLHICKVLITLSGGQIRVESKQGEWCKFTFTLPSELPDKKSLLKIPDQTKEIMSE